MTARAKEAYTEREKLKEECSFATIIIMYNNYMYNYNNYYNNY